MKVTFDGGHTFEGAPKEIEELMRMMGTEFPTKKTEEETEAKPRTVKRKARVGERILITETVGSGGEYSIGDVRTVKRVLDGGVFVEEHGIGLYHSEYEVIAPTFSEGDRVKVLAYGEDRDIKVGEIGTVEDIHDDEDDPYTIGVESDEGNYDYFRPEDLELVEEKPYKPSEGDIVVITGNTNRSRNAVGDIGKVGEVAPDNTARVHVPSRPNSDKVNDNWTKFSEMRPATDEEKAKYERAVKFAELGRKPGEFKKGDIVRYVGRSTLNGVTLEVYEDTEDGRTKVDFRKHNYGICTEKNEELELIAPVESRVDLDD